MARVTVRGDPHHVNGLHVLFFCLLESIFLGVLPTCQTLRCSLFFFFNWHDTERAVSSHTLTFCPRCKWQHGPASSIIMSVQFPPCIRSFQYHGSFISGKRWRAPSHKFVCLVFFFSIVSACCSLLIWMCYFTYTQTKHILLVLLVSVTVLCFAARGGGGRGVWYIIRLHPVLRSVTCTYCAGCFFRRLGCSQCLLHVQRIVQVASLDAWVDYVFPVLLSHFCTSI